MRDIKFRCWDTENKEMLEVQELDYEDSYNGQPMIRTTMYSDYFDTEDMILMQYVGLKDKNGKEIYEGYIVSFNLKSDSEGQPYIIGYIEYQTTFSGYRIMSFEGSFALDYNIKDIEVIGNIYDNPELLKK